MSQYAVLAPIYETIGLSAFADSVTPQILAYAQGNDWLGRHILDLGCGTGAASRWLATKGYSLTGIDHSAEMLSEAARRFDASGFGLEWRQGDIRALPSLDEHYDLAIALDVINELGSLRELEAVFQGVGKALGVGKWFIFDLHTIQGLMEQATHPAAIWMDNDDLFVTAAQHVDYDRQTLTEHVHIFRRSSQMYVRQTAERVLRGFPVQAVTALLGRASFGIIGVFSPRFEAVDPANANAARVIIAAHKLGNE